MEVTVREAAQRELELLPERIRRTFLGALSRLDAARTLPIRDLDIVAIRGSRSLHRLAVGEYRAVFRFDGRGRCDFLTFGPRAGFYQRFR